MVIYTDSQGGSLLFASQAKCVPCKPDHESDLYTHIKVGHIAVLHKDVHMCIWHNAFQFLKIHQGVVMHAFYASTQERGRRIFVSSGSLVY